MDPSNLGPQAQLAPSVLAAFQAGRISSGKAAGLLGLSKAGFLQLLEQCGLPYMDMSLDELTRQAAVALAASRSGPPA